MATVRAAVMVEPGKIEMEDFPKPDIAEDEMLLKIESVGICGSDKHMYMGHSKMDFPLIAGHELVGTIAEMGSKANDVMNVIGGPVKEGDLVTVTPSSKACGKCYNCLHFPHKPTLCTDRFVYGFTTAKIKPHLYGGFAEFMYLSPRSWVFKVPKRVKDRGLGALTEPVAVATRAIERALPPGLPFIGEGIGIGSNVIVVGAGPIGLIAVAALKSFGAGKVIAVDIVQSRLDEAVKMGADAVVTGSTAEERIKQCIELTNDIGADVVIEFAGVPSAFVESIEMTRRGGKLIEAGHYTDSGSVEVRPHIICRKDLDICGMWAYPPIQFEKALNFISRSSAPLEDLVTHRLPLEKLEDGIKIMGTEGVMKPFIEP